MSVSKWAYTPEKCDGDYCPGDCDNCLKSEYIDEEVKANAISFNEPTHEGYAERCNHTQNEGAYDE